MLDCCLHKLIRSSKPRSAFAVGYSIVAANYSTTTPLKPKDVSSRRVVLAIVSLTAIADELAL